MKPVNTMDSVCLDPLALIYDLEPAFRALVTWAVSGTLKSRNRVRFRGLGGLSRWPGWRSVAVDVVRVSVGVSVGGVSTWGVVVVR